jgi:hypothetical protein
VVSAMRLMKRFDSVNSQNAQWDRLVSLIKKKRSIEAQIIDRLKYMEKISLNFTTELDAVFADRLEDIAKLDTIGKI